MMMKKTVPAALALCLALMAVSCIYPFTPESEDGSGTLVVEGDIFIGEPTTVSLSYAAPVGKTLKSAFPSSAEVWVEDDAGTVFRGQHQRSGQDPEALTFTVDTREADPSRDYRLHVNVADEGREYVSSWERVCSAPVIDSLSYNLDFTRDRLNVALSMHSGNESYFKWDYVEDWEYHAPYFATLKLIVTQTQYYSGNVHVSVNVQPMDHSKNENTYYCYGHNVSKNIMTFSTEKQTDDRFVDLEFRPIDRDDLRISYLYRIRVMLEPLSRDAYDYWENIKTNSDYNGSLFAPNPSEVVGNIRCVQDPGVFVLGYINVAQRARKELVIDAAEHRFFKSKESIAGNPELISFTDWKTYYENGYLPYTYYIPNDISQTYWLPARCVDCMKWVSGGARGVSRNKPEDWPPQTE